MEFATPAFLWGLLLLPLVVAIHFVRKAKQLRKVSALWLWSKAQQQTQKQRFSPTWLLLLQLLAVAATCLAAANPHASLGNHETAIIIESSAAMLATDLTPTRLDVAKSEALKIIQQSGKVLLIRAGTTAQVLSSSNDKTQTIKTLQSIEAGDATANLIDSLSLAHNNVSGVASIHVFSVQVAPKNFFGTWHVLQGTGQNIGITGFAWRGQQLFASVETNLNSPLQAELLLLHNNKEIARTTLRLPAAGQAIWTPNILQQPGQYELQITNNKDALGLDDKAFIEIRTGRVMLAGNFSMAAEASVLHAVASVPGLRLETRERVAPTFTGLTRGYDANIFIGNLPKKLGPGNYILFQNPNKKTTKTETINAINQSHPYLRFANLSGISAKLGSELPELPSGTETEIHWQELASANGKAFLLAGTGTNIRVVYFAAHPSDTNLSQHPAFPVILYNALESFLETNTLQLGQRNNAAQIQLQAGFLTTTSSDGTIRPLTANLFSSYATQFPRGESSTITIVGNNKSSRNAETRSQLKDVFENSTTTQWLLAIALLALMTETWLRLRGGTT